MNFLPSWTVARQAPLSMGFSRQEYWSGLPCPPPGGLPNPGIKLRSPTLQPDSLPSEPLGKLKITGMCSLSLLQGVFLTQTLNRGLLHCRWILYQLSYQGSPLHLDYRLPVKDYLCLLRCWNQWPGCSTDAGKE